MKPTKSWKRSSSLASGLLGILAAMTATGLALPRPSAADPLQAPYSRFAHPLDGDAIRAGEPVRVVAHTMFEDPPADLELRFCEDVAVCGGNCADWTLLEDVRLRGRVITGTYRPTAAQGAIVKFATCSSTPGFTGSVETFVE